MGVIQSQVNSAAVSQTYEISGDVYFKHPLNFFSLETGRRNRRLECGKEWPRQAIGKGHRLDKQERKRGTVLTEDRKIRNTNIDCQTHELFKQTPVIWVMEVQSSLRIRP